MKKEERIKNLKEAFELMIHKYEETGNNIYKTLSKDIQQKLIMLGETE